jgi:hypothetical protein
MAGLRYPKKGFVSFHVPLNQLHDVASFEQLIVTQPASNFLLLSVCVKVLHGVYKCCPHFLNPRSVLILSFHLLLSSRGYLIVPRGFPTKCRHLSVTQCVLRAPPITPFTIDHELRRLLVSHVDCGRWFARPLLRLLPPATSTAWSTFLVIVIVIVTSELS